jgi:ferredoxin
MWLMATLVKKVKENIPGEFFVDSSCIDCDLCRQTAPNFFRRKLEGITGYSFVANQPRNSAEEAVCLEAMEACPVNAIGQN